MITVSMKRIPRQSHLDIAMTLPVSIPQSTRDGQQLKAKSNFATTVGSIKPEMTAGEFAVSFRASRSMEKVGAVPGLPFELKLLAGRYKRGKSTQARQAVESNFWVFSLEH
jgi:hypothetical protein